MNIDIPENVKYIIETLEACGFEAYAVGGCIRDSLKGIFPHDWDICTSATPKEVKVSFPDNCIIETGIKHGTVTIVLNNENFEITTYRTEGRYSDGGHLDNVSFTASLTEDLSHRDFTVNAMAYNHRKGLVDPYSGEKDLQNGILRCVGNPCERFGEDPLRILRALRFVSTQNLQIEALTDEAIFAFKHDILIMPEERIKAEFEKMLLGSNVRKVLMDYKKIIATFIPEIEPCFNFNQNNPSHAYDVWEHTAESIQKAKRDRIVRLVMFFHDIGKPHCYIEDICDVGHFYGHGIRSAEMTEDIMKRLRFDSNTINTVTTLVKYHDNFIEESPNAIRRLLNKIGEENLRYLFDIREADVLAQNTEYLKPRLDKLSELRAIADNIIAERQCFSIKDLAVNGNDLIELGYKPGLEIGEKLKELLEVVINNPKMNIKETLIKLIA